MVALVFAAPTQKVSLPTNLNIHSFLISSFPSTYTTRLPDVVPCSNSILWTPSLKATSQTATRSAIFPRLSKGLGAVGCGRVWAAPRMRADSAAQAAGPSPFAENRTQPPRELRRGEREHHARRGFVALQVPEGPGAGRPRPPRRAAPPPRPAPPLRVRARPQHRPRDPRTAASRRPSRAGPRWRGADAASRGPSAPPGARGGPGAAPRCMWDGRAGAPRERPAAPPRRCPAARGDGRAQRRCGPGPPRAAPEHGPPGGSSRRPRPGGGTRKQKRSRAWSRAAAPAARRRGAGVPAAGWAAAARAAGGHGRGARRGERRAPGGGRPRRRRRGPP